MKISVAMCTYNGSRFVRDQLKSFAIQTRLPDELIVCDDNSCDETVNIISDFAKTAPFPVRLYVNSTNLGVVKNFEKAVKLCNGDLIALSDQDDVWLPEKLLLEEEIFRSHPEVGLVFTNAEVVDEKLTPLGYDLWSTEGFNSQKQRLVLEGKAFEVLLKRNFVTGATMMFKRKFLEACMPFPYVTNEMIKSSIIHDYWIALIISALADIRFIDKKVVRYRQHTSHLLGASITNKIQVIECSKFKEHPDELNTLLGANNHKSHKLNLFRGIHLKKYNFSPFIEDFSPFIEDLNRKINQLKWVENALSRNRERAAGSALLLTRREIINLEEKIAHLNARQQVHSSGFSKGTLLIMRELASSRYHKHSNGLRSALKDFVSCLV